MVVEIGRKGPEWGGEGLMGWFGDMEKKKEREREREREEREGGWRQEAVFVFDSVWAGWAG